MRIGIDQDLAYRIGGYLGNLLTWPYPLDDEAPPCVVEDICVSSRDSMSSRSSDVVFLNSTVSVALVGALTTNAGLGCCDGRVSPVGLARGQV